MATRDDRSSTKANRDDYDTKAKALGHDLDWKLGENANRKGYAYFLIGTCRNCAGNIHVGATWTSTTSIIDARHQPCTGPGTAILTEIERGRLHELVTAAVAEFGIAVRATIARMN